MRYDSGDFPAVFERAVEIADIKGFKQRKREAKKRGRLRGLGICFVLEHAGGSPVEGTKVSFPGGDNLMFTMNIQSTGQSHATIFPRLVAERLGIRADQVGHAHGDSAHEIAGYASVGSRTAMTAGHAMVKTLEAMLAKGKGAIVNVTSIAGSRVHPFAGAAYATTKAALASLTREMAADFGPLGVRPQRRRGRRRGFRCRLCRGCRFRCCCH